MYTSLNIISMIKLRMGWVGHVACMGEVYTKCWLRNLKGRDHLKDEGIDGMMVLDWILGKLGRKVWTGFI